MQRFKRYALLAGILLFGLGLRLYHNLDISLWHDEAFSALLIKYPWGEMIHRIGLDVHPPVYYITLRLWNYALGNSLLSLRGFSIFFGLLTAVGAYGFVQTAFKSPKAATISALLIAISPFQLQYATEARMYTFGAFLAIFAAYFLVRALQESNQTKRIVFFTGFGLVAGLAALTHYYLLFTVAALCLYGLLHQAYYYRSKLAHYWPLVGSYVLIIVIFSPWLTWFLYQYKQVGAGYWIPPLDIWSIPTTLWQMLLGIGVDIAHKPTQALVLLTTLFSVYFSWAFIRKMASPHKWLVLLAFIAPFGGSILFALLAKLKGGSSSVYLVRYFLYASTFYTIALSVWLTNIKWRFVGYGLLGLYAITNILAFAHYWQDLQVVEKPGMHGAVHYLQSKAKPTDHLFVGSSFEFFNLKYYLSQTRPPTGTLTSPKSMTSRSYSLEDLSDDSPRPTPTTPEVAQYWPTPLLFTGGRYVHDMQHFEGTAILTDADLVPHFSEAVKTGDTVWLLWTNGFGGSKPEVPANWKQTDEAGFAEVRPYVGTWIIVTKYFVK